jgi:hypothetical protein
MRKGKRKGRKDVLLIWMSPIVCLHISPEKEYVTRTNDHRYLTGLDVHCTYSCAVNSLNNWTCSPASLITTDTHPTFNSFPCSLSSMFCLSATCILGFRLFYSAANKQFKFPPCVTQHFPAWARIWEGCGSPQQTCVWLPLESENHLESTIRFWEPSDGHTSLARYPDSSMSPQWWPRLLTTWCVLTLWVVRKKSGTWSTIQSCAFLVPEWAVHRDKVVT